MSHSVMIDSDVHLLLQALHYFEGLATLMIRCPNMFSKELIKKVMEVRSGIVYDQRISCKFGGL